MTFSLRNLFEDSSLVEEEDAFEQVANKIAEAEEKIMGTREGREARERINEEVFQRNISHRLKHASLRFQFHIAFGHKRDFSELERLTEAERLKKLKFWKYWLFRSLEGLEKNRRNYLEKIAGLWRDSLVARDERYISQVCFAVINDEIRTERRTLLPKYYQIVFEIYEDLRKINEKILHHIA